MSSAVMFALSILNLLIFQLPDFIAACKPLEIVSVLKQVIASKGSLLGFYFGKSLSIYFLRSNWNLLKRSSKRSEIS